MSFWLQGWRWLLQHPRYIGFVFAPWFLAFLMASICIYWIWNNAYSLSARIGGFFSASPVLADVSAWVVYILILILFFMGGLLLFYAFYLLLCPPFYSVLVEKVLEKSGKKPKRPMGFSLWISTTAGMFKAAIFKSAVFGSLALLVLMIGWIPGMQLIVPLFAAFVVAFDSMDYSFEVLGFSFRKRLSYVKTNRDQFGKMFLSMALTLLVPGLTFLALPGAVVGAALNVRVPESKG